MNVKKKSLTFIFVKFYNVVSHIMNKCIYIIYNMYFMDVQRLLIYSEFEASRSNKQSVPGTTLSVLLQQRVQEVDWPAAVQTRPETSDCNQTPRMGPDFGLVFGNMSNLEREKQISLFCFQIHPLVTDIYWTFLYLIS